MKSKYRFLIILFFSFTHSIDLLYAQAFNTFNGRNHPEIVWHKSSTEHFELIYGKHLENIIPEIAIILEESYDILSQNLGLTFDRKIKFYFSDEDEISNGAASPLLGMYSYIWINVHDYEDSFTGNRKWLRTVLSHELAHLFHFEGIRSNMGIWNYLFGNPPPREFMEGLAQYETEKWNALRGDQSLRLAVFDDELDYFDGTSKNAGGLLYATGYSKVLFLQELFGDSTLTKLMKGRTEFLLGLNYYDFDEAFEEVTGITYQEFGEKWRKHVNIYYNTLAGQMDRTDSLKGVLQTYPGDFIESFKVSPDGSRAVASILHSIERPIFKLVYFEKDSINFVPKRIIDKGRTNHDISWSGDSNTIYYSRLNRGKYGSIVNDIYSYSFEENHKSRITYNSKIVSPIPSGKNTLYAVQNQGQTSNIVEISIETGEIISTLTSFQNDMQFSDLSINSSLTQLAGAVSDSLGNHSIFTLNLGDLALTLFGNPNYDDRDPKFIHNDSHIIFTSLRDNVPNIFILNLSTHEERRVTNIFTGAHLFDWVAPNDSSQSGQLFISSTEKKSKDYLHIVADTLVPYYSIASIPKSYSSWIDNLPSTLMPDRFSHDDITINYLGKYSPISSIRPLLSFGYPIYGEETGLSVVGLSLFTDPLGKHQFFLFGNLSFGDRFKKDTYGVFSYINRTFSPTISFNAYRLPSSFRFYGNNFLVDNLGGLELMAKFPINYPYTPYTSSSLSLGTAFEYSSPVTSSFLEATSLNAPPLFDSYAQRFFVRYTLKKLEPYDGNILHPLDGYGLEFFSSTGNASSNQIFDSSSSTFQIFDIRVFKLFPSFGLHRIYAYLRASVQLGEPLPQDRIGLSRYDNISLQLQTIDGSSTSPIRQQAPQERVRGYRTFILGSNVLFSSLEYRIPLLSDLDTKILGLVEFLGTSFSLFSDQGVVNNISFGSNQVRQFQWGLGSEIKNTVRVLGLDVIHSVGFGQPYTHFASDKLDWHYRISATLAF